MKKIRTTPLPEKKSGQVKSGQVILFFASHEIVPSLVPPALPGDLRSLIDATRVRVAVGINSEMVLLYWDIGESPSARVETSRYLKIWSSPEGFLIFKGNPPKRKYFLKGALTRC